VTTATVSAASNDPVTIHRGHRLLNARIIGFYLAARRARHSHSLGLLHGPVPRLPLAGAATLNPILAIGPGHQAAALGRMDGPFGVPVRELGRAVCGHLSRCYLGRLHTECTGCAPQDTTWAEQRSALRTIVRDIAALRRRGLQAPTRGQQQDSGPGQANRTKPLSYRSTQSPARGLARNSSAAAKKLRQFCGSARSL
jgi:hypothetical protein